MQKNKSNTEHYNWGNQCHGWHLVKSQNLSIIEELMPPNTEEKLHYHENAEQFFYILSGKATFILNDKTFVVNSNEGIHILSKTPHLIKNQTEDNLSFLVISQPTSKCDRIEI